jgi:hypothetical protein
MMMSEITVGGDQVEIFESRRRYYAKNSSNRIGGADDERLFSR